VQWQSSPSTIKTDAVASIAGTGTPYQYGPNKGCPRPIVALTNKNGKATIKTAIDQMLAYWATGTYIPAGLVWGWHVLSPTEPYTEGIAPSDPLHSKTLKAMVLLTDGDNDVSPGGTKSNYYTVNQNNNLSRYSGYGYLAKGRLGSSLATAASSLDAKTATLCGNIKADGIRVYSISFGSLSAESKSMLSDCASVEKGDRLYYHAPNSSDLAEIFREIGEDLSNLHVSK
jgi:hypothetical protein